MKGRKNLTKRSGIARGERPARARPAPLATPPDAKAEEQAGFDLEQLLHECVTCGIIVIQGPRIVTLTPEAARILGLSLEQRSNASTSALPPALVKLVKGSASSRLEQINRQIDLAIPGQAPVAVSVRVVRAPQKQGALQVVVLNRVTSPGEMHDNLRQLDRLASVGSLSASMVHEIKNALVAGKTFFDLLLEKHQDAELATIVRREMNRIESIVSQMLRFAGSAQPTQTAVHVHQVLDHSLRLIQPQLEAKAIALDRSFSARSDLVSGDDYQLQQAFVNLLMNALEATQPHGAVSVATELIRTAIPGANDPAQLRVIIQDTGAGISPEHMCRLFEPFFTTKTHGTGLGLPITHRIIQEHRGSIRVDSAPNKGATFSILLPALIPA